MEPSYPPDMQAVFFKIGRYLYDFGLMELALDECIRRGLDISEEQSTAINKLISMSSKITLVKDIINQQNRDTTWKGNSIKICEKVASVPEDRNLVAHSVFKPINENDIEFKNRNLMRRPGDTLSSSVIWKNNEYEGKCAKLERLKVALECLARELMPVVYGYGAMTEEPDQAFVTGTVTPAPPDAGL